MASMNRVFLIGNLTRDPELRYTPGGTPVASFGLAVNTTFSTKASGTPEPKTETCFVRIVAWGRQAETCNQYLKKGRAVCVEGRLIYRSWEQDGKTRSTLEVRADRVQFLSPRREEGEAAAVETPSEEPVAADVADAGGDDEPPF